MTTSHRSSWHDATLSANQRLGIWPHWPIRGRHHMRDAGGAVWWTDVRVSPTQQSISRSQGNIYVINPGDKHEVRGKKTEIWLEPGYECMLSVVECLCLIAPYLRDTFFHSLSPLWPSSFVSISSLQGRVGLAVLQWKLRTEEWGLCSNNRGIEVKEVSGSVGFWILVIFSGGLRTSSKCQCKRYDQISTFAVLLQPRWKKAHWQCKYSLMEEDIRKKTSIVDVNYVYLLAFEQHLNKTE